LLIPSPPLASDLIVAAPTALALTTSLLGTELPPAACKRHIALFAASTPVGALLSYGLGSLVAGGVSGEWTGLGMLVSVRLSCLVVGAQLMI
jgi:zinc transporter 9